MSGSLSIRNNHLYYVDATSGDDNNSGHHADDAWQTIAKVNASTFQPGDQILFKRGETWSGTVLTPPSNGVSGLPIVFGNYGSGAIPVIDGDSSYACDLGSGENYLIFSGIEFTTVTGTVAVRINSAHHIDFEDCDFNSATNINLWLYGSGTDVHDIDITDCISYDAGGSGGFVLNAASYPGPTDITFTGCSAYSNGSSATLHHGWYIQQSNRVTISGCSSYSNASNGIALSSYSTNITVEKSRLYSNGSRGFELTILEAGNGSILRNNLIYSNTTQGVRFADTCVGVTFIHNTVFNNGTNLTVDNVMFTAGATGNTFKNNICVYDKAVNNANRWPINVGNAAIVENNTFDNNCYITLNGTNQSQAVNGSNITLANWRLQTGTPDVNGMNADPVFVTPYTDLHLQSSSPCRNAGADLDVLKDYDGVARDDTPDIGAYEYVA